MAFNNHKENGMKQLNLGFQFIKVIALAVTDKNRAERFYSEALGLQSAFEVDLQMGFIMG